MLSCADPSFGLNHQALAILHFLAGRPPSFARHTEGRFHVTIQTYPWVNGRIRGVALVIYRDLYAFGPSRVIVFAEDIGTDRITVEHWDRPDAPSEAPTPADRETLLEAKEWAGAKTLEQKTFGHGQIGEAADHIYGLMETFYSEKKLQLVGDSR